MLTTKQKGLVELLKSALPNVPAEVAQDNVGWYRAWTAGEPLAVGDRRSWENVLYQAYAPAGDNLCPPDQAPAIFKQVRPEELKEAK